jgi:hypothetical protein
VNNKNKIIKINFISFYLGVSLKKELVISKNKFFLVASNFYLNLNSNIIETRIKIIFGLIYF